MILCKTMISKQPLGGRVGKWLAALLAVLAMASCEPATQTIADSTRESASQVFLAGQIYTMNKAQPWASAMAIDAGQILAVGTDAEISQWIGTETKVDDLAGQFVMPGIIDGHAHPAWGGVTAVFFCLFPATALPVEVQSAIEGCVANAPAQDVWIQGGLWAADFFTQYQIESPRRWLDAISKDKAIALKDDSGHNYWFNSKALELVGIDENSIPPPGGAYHKSADGKLNGVLLEVFAQVAV